MYNALRFTPKKQLKGILMSYFRLITLLLPLCLLGCGGGGSESSSSHPPPVSVPDSTTPLYTLVEPDYKGKRTDFKLDSANAGTVLLDVLAGLDMLNVIAFSDELDHLLIFSSESDNTSINATDEIACITGSGRIIEVEKSKQYRVEYNSCRQGNVITDGTLDLYVKGNNLEVLPHVSFNDLSSSEFLEVTGYIKVTGSTASYRNYAQYFLMLEDENDNQMYFEDFVLKVSSGDGLFYEGDVYLSEYGKLNLVTQEVSSESNSYEQTLAISSINSINVDIVVGQSASFKLDEESIPLDIQFASISPEFFDQVNDAPIAVITSEKSKIEREEALLLSSTGSFDKDLDILTYKWEILSSPQNAVSSISSGHDMTFSADLPGDYHIQLTVDDGKGLQSTDTLLLKVEKGTPVASFVEEEANVVINSNYASKIVLENDVFDGPFTYRVAYGPNGLEVDSEGNITWPANVPNIGRELDVHYAIDVWNDNKLHRFEKSVVATPSPDRQIDNLYTNLYTPFGHQWVIPQTLSTKDSQEYQLGQFRGNKQAKVYLDEKQRVRIKPLQLNFRLDDNEVSLYDFDADGIEDFINYTTNSDGSGDSSVSIFSKNAVSLETEELFTIASDDFRYISQQDVNGDGSNELILWTNDNKSYVYQLNNKTLLYTNETVGAVVDFCDIDGNGLDEIVTQSAIYRIDDGNVMAEFSLNEGDRIDPIMVNGVCQLVVRTETETKLARWLSNKLDYVELVELIDRETDIYVGKFRSEKEEVLFYDVIEEGAKAPDEYQFNWSIMSINADFTVTVEEIVLPTGVELKNLNYFLGHWIFPPFDIDGDGLDELITHLNFEQPFALSALSITDDQISTKYSGLEVFKEYPDTHSGIAAFDGDTLVTNQVIFSDGSYSRLNESIGSRGAEFAAAEILDGVPYYYSRSNQGSSNGYLQKFDQNHVSQWITDTTDTIWPRFINFIPRKDEILAHYTLSNGLVSVNKRSGELVQFLPDFDVDTKNLVFSPMSFEQNLLFINAGKTLYNIEQGSLAELMTVTDSEYTFSEQENHSASSHRYDFVQYDEDPQLELVFGYNGSDRYALIDTKTKLVEAYRKGDNGVYSSNDYSNFREVIDNCLGDDVLCQNRLVVVDEHLALQDKLTGKIIWKLEYIAQRNYEFAYHVEQNGKVKLAAYIEYYGWYVFH